MKIISFISGRPNYGIGSVLSESEDKISPVNSFYKEVAKKAVAAGVSFDLICFYEEEKFINFALPTIKFLSMYTGGHTSLYQLHEDDLSSIHALFLLSPLLSSSFDLLFFIYLFIILFL